MKTYIIVGFVLILLIAGGVFVWYTWPAKAPAPTPPLEEEPVVTTETYSSSTLGIAITYPRAFSVNEDYAYPFSNTRTISGVKFTIPESIATGTNLSPNTYLSVEQLPRANNCTGDIYVIPNVTANEVVEGSTTYSLATTSSAAAGNRYEEMVYALIDSEPCTAVRYFIHTTALENYDEGTVREYDRTALLQAFDEIRRSLRLTLTP